MVRKSTPPMTVLATPAMLQQQ